MAEQFAFEKIFGNSGAIDAHITCGGAAAGTVESAGNQLLAGAAFPENQYACFGGRHRLNELAQLAHLGAIADDLLQSVSLPRTGAQAGVFLQQTITFRATRDRMQQFLGRERLGEIIDRAGFNGLHSQLRRSVGGDHQQRKVRPLGAGLG